jgi:hypothetical protein
VFASKNCRANTPTTVLRADRVRCLSLAPRLLMRGKIKNRRLVPRTMRLYQTAMVAIDGTSLHSPRCNNLSVIGGGLNWSTQHFIFERKDGV